MLSEETAVGVYPTDTVRTMAEVAEAAECWPSARIDPAGAAAANDDDRVAWAVAHAAVQAAEDLGVAAIVCPTQSGTTARRVAAFRPSVPIVGSSDQPEALGGLSLVWGVRPLAVAPGHDRHGPARGRAARRARRRHRARRRSRRGRVARRKASAPAAPTPSASSAPDQTRELA